MIVDLVNDDCLNVMSNWKYSQVDLILTDIPYGTIACEWDTIVPLEEMWNAVDQVTHDNTVICLFCAQPFTSVLGNSNIQNLRYSYVWKKSIPTGHLNAKQRPMTDMEDILVFYKQQPKYFPQGLIPYNKMVKNSRSDTMITSKNPRATVTGNIKSEKYLQQYTNYPSRILQYNSVIPSESVHPTQKPVDLLAYLIRTYTCENDLVLDFTMGSGSTGVASLQENRKFIGIEQDHEYYIRAKTRINDYIASPFNQLFD
jgi:site-specific DNA-methyltransferase (adenine-specific)